MERSVLKIVGMSCSHCEAAVADALKALDGVEAVEVDVAGGKATVSYRAGAVTEETLKKAVEEAGYEVVA